MITLQESVDIDRLLIIRDNWDALYPKLGKFNNFQQGKMEEAQAKTVFNTYVAQKLKTTSIEYKFAGRLTEGRLFSRTTSLQNMPKVIRHTISSEIYDDIDIVNAHVVFLLHLCSLNNFSHTYLSYYTNNRTKCLEELINLYNISREDAKKIPLKLINGGLLPKFQNLPEWLVNLNSELTKVRQQLLALPENKKYLKRALEKKDYNTEGSALNYILCRIENEVLQCMAEYLNDKNIQIGVYVFDGLMIYKQASINFDELLHDMETFVKDKTGFPIKLSVKEMTEGISLDGYSKKEEVDFSDEACGIYILNDLKGRLNYSVSKNILYFYNTTSCLHEPIKPIYLMSLFSKILGPLINLVTDDTLKQKYTSLSKSTNWQRGVLTQIIIRLSDNKEDDFIQENFDRIPHLFPIGKHDVVNLRNGEIRLRTQDDFFTKTTSNVYKKDWDREFVDKYFLDLFGGSEELARNLKRICGYLLTNENNVKKIFILFGPEGNNGKSTLIKLLSKIMQHFSVEANERIFKKGAESVHNTELTELVSMRLSYISEMSSKDIFNEQLAKKISGNDKIFSVRKAGSPDVNQCVIESKLMIGSNNIAKFSDPTFANRICAIPFNQIFESNQDVEDKLLSISNDFFSCFCDEAVEFYKNDRLIKFCSDVLITTQGVKDEQDSFKLFIEENYTLTDDDSDRIKKSEFFDHYTNYCKKSEVQPLTRNKFYSKVEKDLKLDIYKKIEYKKIKINNPENIELC